MRCSLQALVSANRGVYKPASDTWEACVCKLMTARVQGAQGPTHTLVSLEDTAAASLRAALSSACSPFSCAACSSAAASLPSAASRSCAAAYRCSNHVFRIAPPTGQWDQLLA